LSASSPSVLKEQSPFANCNSRVFVIIVILLEYVKKGSYETVQKAINCSVGYWDNFGSFCHRSSTLWTNPSKDIKIATYYILVADFSLPFILLALPLAIGFDIIAWTIGVIIWLFGYGSWPGQALEIFLSAHPVIHHVFYVVFLLLGYL